jgi:cobalt-zinc-cadmium efflux system protein
MSHHHHHASGHGHQHTVTTDERKLIFVIGLTGLFFLAEIAGGIITQSLALLSDAAHMFTDLMALVIALIAIRIGKRAVDDRRTYGYRRFEILAAALNPLLLFLAALYILYEAYERFLEPPAIQTGGMMIIAFAGLAINLVCMLILCGGRESCPNISLNMKGAYLEVFSDMLGSAGVLAGALIIRFTGWAWIDPALALLIAMWVLPRAWRLFSESLNILLEGVPAGIELQRIREELAALPGVYDVHDLHIWAITSGQNSLTAHLQVSVLPADDTLLKQAQDIVRHHNIVHTNFQVEIEHVGMHCDRVQKCSV